MSQTISQIPNSAVDICPILIGTTVPKLILTTVDEKPFDLNTAITKKPTILIFYRGGWCPYCNVHLGQLQEIESQLIKLGYQIIALSTDRPEKLRESIQKHNLKYLLLSDNKMIAAKIFRIAFKVDDKTIAQYKKYGINLEDASGEKHHFLPVPAVFIIGTDGVIKFEYVNPNPNESDKIFSSQRRKERKEYLATDCTDFLFVGSNVRARHISIGSITIPCPYISILMCEVQPHLYGISTSSITI